MAKNCINPDCRELIRSKATFCEICGWQQDEEELRKKLNEAKKELERLEETQPNSNVSAENSQAIENLQKQIAEMLSKIDAIKTPPPSKPFPTSILVVGLALLLIVGALVGYFAFYKPYAERREVEELDRNAPRFRVFANVFLRKCPEKYCEKVIEPSLSYNSELIVYNDKDGWAEVKYYYNNEPKKGYVFSAYILPFEDFKILDGIWGDGNSQENIIHARWRRALFSYFKENSYSGSWKIYSKKNTKPNTIYEGNITNKSSNIPDFAVIIKNINTGDRKCLIFSFNDDETLRSVYERQAPETGDITNITVVSNPYNNDYNYVISYSK